ncbi:hexosaminidase D [Paramormyrops kingsleyae]|uniref:beta-N-acetylhexosaminidase n=1 Tax=Paramormyrops kingsleyae TaxID=1676925 RepID=A0A3B3R2C1_9TELE|nr:hexosaminidase D-like [Paramormyrops kingsleyae]
MRPRMQLILRLLVVCLVCGAIVKLALQPSPKTAAKETLIRNVKFWKSVQKSSETWNGSPVDRHLPTPEAAKGSGVTEPVPKPQPHLQQSSGSPLRIVHLDLKGAAPKVKYLEQIFPLLSALGADGVLMEYEDMFPYEGDLHLLRSPHAYSLEDIQTIRTLARLSKLEMIPLVQIFGHLEFVLKHEEFNPLREVAAFPNSLNPHAPGVRTLITDMVMQVLNQHPDSRWFHIGADEVYGLGESQDSKNWLHANEGNVGKMFLNHVTAVAGSVLEKRPNISLLMWDDMMRMISVADLKASNLPRIASPVIWRYRPDFNTGHVESLISKYQDSGFASVWFASAFKGASGADQRWTPLDHHLKNHLIWLKVMEAMPKYPSISFQGIILTGWQRYEHFSVLCELLPVGVPSLALCLQTLKHGDFSDQVKKEVEHILGCKLDVKNGTCEGSGAFSGSELYHMVHHIHTNLQSDMKDLLGNRELQGVFSLYHRKYHIGNPRNLGIYKTKMEQALKHWESYLENFRVQMEAIYFPDTVEEWMDENVNPSMDQLRGLVADLGQIIALEGKPKSARL